MHRLISEHPDVHSITKESFLFTAPNDLRIKLTSEWQAVAIKKKKKLIVEKTPWHLFHIKELSTLIPNAKFICMIRDGRDVVASLMKRGPTARIDGTLDGCKDLWLKSCRELDSIGCRIGVYTQRLEDLCADPSAVLRSTLQFLDLRHHDAILNHILSYSERPLAVYANTFHKPLSAKDGEGHVRLRNYQINSPIFSTTSRYADELGKHEIEYLTKEMKAFLKRYSYI